MEDENITTEDFENSYKPEILIEPRSIDGEQIADIAIKSVDVLSIIGGYLGVLAILSYPLVHIISVFCNIDKFIASLPLGYTTSVANWDGMPNSGKYLMIFFGFLCLFIGSKMCLWLNKYHSIKARITCIIAGIVFMVCMCSKDANNILLTCINFIGIISFIVFVGIPAFALASKFTPLGQFLPPNFIPNYYRGLMKIFPKN